MPGVYARPFGFALSVPVAGSEHLVPIAAPSAAALGPIASALAVVRRSGGFALTSVAQRTVEARLTFDAVPDLARAQRRLRVLARALLELGRSALPARQRLAFRPALHLSTRAPATLSISIYSEGPVAVEAHGLARVAEAMVPALTRLVEAGAHLTLRDVVRERVRVGCCMAVREIVGPVAIRRRELVHERDAVQSALQWLAAAQGSSLLAGAQNDIVLAPVAAVARALGQNAERAVAEGHGYAGRFGVVAPLARLGLRGPYVTGSLELPYRGDPRGGRQDIASQLPQRLLRGHAVENVAALSACIGLAAHLASLKGAAALVLTSPTHAGAAPSRAPSRANRRPLAADLDDTRVMPARSRPVPNGAARAWSPMGRSTPASDDTRVMSLELRRRLTRASGKAG